jgi:hydrogenase/urease accessory protein HupE
MLDVRSWTLNLGGPLPWVVGRIPRSTCLLLAFFLSAVAALAHNPDTSYARCVVASDHVELRLTYDIFTLLKISDIDTDHDGRLTRDELRAGAGAIQRFLREHVLFEVDGQAADLGEALDPVWPKGAPDAIAAPDWHAAESLIVFPFRRNLSTPPHDIALTFTFFGQLGAQHTVLGVFDHAGQTQEVTFTEGEPDYLYDVTYVAGNKRDTLLTTLRRFLVLGINHILFGYDHICFLLALLVAVNRLRDLVKIITSFTIAHSITLILAALKIVTLPQRLVECGVALTIIYVAVENLWRKNITHRWTLTFVFGLIHGFGFATVLGGLELPREALVRCLLSFNVGVEIAQLGIVLAAMPLLALLAKSGYATRTKIIVSVCVGLFGMGWFVDRAFQLRFMPF